MTKFLMTAEVARRLHVSPRTVSRYARHGLLPHVLTPGGHRRYPEPAVNELARRLNEGLSIELMGGEEPAA